MINVSVFQSTPPRGRRLAWAEETLGLSVSIHASAREATYRIWDWWRRGLCFNPRLREGGDRNAFAKHTTLGGFQSTPPRGRRPVFCYGALASHVVSIHASAREATHCGGEVYSDDNVSIHASAREATYAGVILR